MAGFFMRRIKGTKKKKQSEEVTVEAKKGGIKVKRRWESLNPFLKSSEGKGRKRNTIVWRSSHSRMGGPKNALTLLFSETRGCRKRKKEIKEGQTCNQGLRCWKKKSRQDVKKKTRRRSSL